jgi:phosphoribosylformylglycinamidine cyclo-ligase
VTSYREAGVDLDAADRHTDSIGSSVTRTWTNEVVGGFGGFAAGVRVPTGYVDPVLMMTTDGVGTKLEIARRAGLWGGVGRDLVAMCVDDLAAAGSKPIGFVDYLAVGSLDAERDTTIVESIADACLEASCPLLGGETAEHPGVMEPAAVDLAGAALGVVESAEVLGPERVGAGDLIVGLMSPNLRSNGFSLVRAVMGADAGCAAGSGSGEFGCSHHRRGIGFQHRAGSTTRIGSRHRHRVVGQARGIRSGGELRRRGS